MVMKLRTEYENRIDFRGQSANRREWSQIPWAAFFSEIKKIIEERPQNLRWLAHWMTQYQSKDLSNGPEVFKKL
jgi:hypothetical protein